ncbi:hypothetical protein ACFFQW_21505 [Umezawaea endophytica]|uniref:Uncharacterized protein n=1 Tax=Umezawaea endophytica TaxID=1654476 RepID=A0A9X2VLH9_9PSEU|nr:hypothetical protein [Umezawaea endophytica]MCS7478810.1 hypothetical protein [Umezawaea endophytica]
MNEDRHGHQLRPTRARRSSRSATGRSTGRSTTPKGRPDATSSR